MSTVSQEQGELFFEDVVASYVKQPRFRPRQWLEKRVQDLLDEADCRFVLITAEPGAGKTAFMAQLAHNHASWLRYFIRRTSTQPLSSGDARSFLFAIGHQLAASQPELFDPDKLKVEVEQDIQENAASGRTTGIEIDDLQISPFFQTSLKVKQKVGIQAGELVGISIRRAVVEERFLELDNLQMLALFHPARALRRAGSPEKIVILVDALDELRYQPGGDHILKWLASCPELPANVRFVLSSRPDDELLAVFRGAQASWLRELPLPTDKVQQAQDPQGYAAVQADVQAYAEALAEQPPVTTALAALGAEQKRVFVRRSVQKADGNLGYLDALGRTIDAALEAGDQEMLARALNLEEVPDTLNGIHAFFLQQIQARVQNESIEVVDATTGESHYLKAWPAVYRRILGVLSVARQPLSMAQVRRLGGIHADETYVSDALGALRQILNPTPGVFSFYHASLPEFLAAPETQANPAYQQLAVNAQEAHRRIVQAYRRGAESWDAVDFEMVDDYGLLQLPAHLQASGAELAAQVVELVNWPVRKAMMARFQTDAAYQSLVDRAAGQALKEPDVDKALPQVFFLALARAQAARSGNWFSPKTLGLMTRLGQVDRALMYLALKNPGLQRFRSAVEIYSHATAQQRQQIGDQLDIERLLELAEEVSNEWNKREHAIAEVARLAAEQDYPRALQILERVKTDYLITSAHKDALAAALRVRTPKEALALLRQELTQNQKLQPQTEPERNGSDGQGEKPSAAVDLYKSLIRRLMSLGGNEETLRQALNDLAALPDYSSQSAKDGDLAALFTSAWYGLEPLRGQMLLDELRQMLFVPLPPQPATDEARYAWQDLVSSRLSALWESARLFETLDPPFSRACLEALEPNSAVFHVDEEVLYLLNEWHKYSILAAEGWLRLGERDKARQWIEATVDSALQRTDRYRWRLLERAAQAMQPIDPVRSTEIIHLAVEAARPEPGSLLEDFDLAELVSGLARFNPLQAEAYARQIQRLTWDETEGDRLSLLAKAALGWLDLEGEPAQPKAQALMDEILTQVREGLQEAAREYGRRTTPSWAAGDAFERISPDQRLFNTMGMMNGYNDWIAMRNWRIFNDPVEVIRSYNDWQLYSIASPFCLGRTLRCLSESIAGRDARLALELAEQIDDPLEAAIAYASIFEAQALLQPDLADQALRQAAEWLNQLQPPGESFLNLVSAGEYPQQVRAYMHLWVQGLVEVAARCVRFHPQYNAQLLQAIPVEYLKHSILAKSADSLLDGSLENFVAQAQQLVAQSGRPTDDAVRTFHVMMANVWLNQIEDPFLVSLALMRAACSLARFSLQQAEEFAQAIPDPLYEGLAWGRMADFLSPSERTPENVRHLAVQAQACLKDDMPVNLRAAILLQAAQALAGIEDVSCKDLLNRALQEIQGSSFDYYTLLAVCELVNRERLLGLLEREQVRQVVLGALPSEIAQNQYLKELLLVLPRLVFYLPETILPRLYQASKAGLYAVLALMDHSAGLAARHGGAGLIRELASAIERARACQGEGL